VSLVRLQAASWAAAGLGGSATTTSRASNNLVGMDDSAGAADEQVETIAKGSRLKLPSARQRVHILSAVFRGLDQWDTLVATTRASESSVQARQRVAELPGLTRSRPRPSRG
jgi:hypothetical protein